MSVCEHEQMGWIEKLMEKGIFKYEDKQLYELSLDELVFLNKQFEQATKQIKNIECQ